MDELVAFLRARIEEEETEALHVPCDTHGWFVLPSPECPDSEWLVDSNPSLICYPSHNRRVQEYIARWDPVRTTNECLAKRELVETYEDLAKECRTLLDSGAGGDARALLDVRRMQAAFSLGYLSLAYRDHPEWKEEWRP